MQASRCPQLALSPLAQAKTRMLTFTLDSHFLIDFHPDPELTGRKNVVLASCCSGHGFKFCAIVGEILADLTINGRTKYDISMFSLAARL